MNIPKDLKYTKEHEWARIEGDTATIGITEYAQGELGDIVFVELPAVGDSTKQFEACANIEAVKAVTDLYAPLSGEVIEVNEKLADTPDIVNKDPYGDGWILKIKLSDTSEADNLLTPEDYEGILP
ncbi:glycine cleavage system protein GcvH [candidate division KSB1 bacterium]|nr:MAG: glycine cleavage system protein GcvH [candidate division KSB1 bacterium]